MLGKQQTENISCKTNLYLFYSMGWSHTIALQPQGLCSPVVYLYSWTIREPTAPQDTTGHILLHYANIFDTEPTALDLTCLKASQSQTGVYQQFLPAFYNFWVLLFANIPMLVLPGPVIISTTCFRFILSVQS